MFNEQRVVDSALCAKNDNSIMANIKTIRLYKETEIQESKTTTANGTVMPDEGYKAMKKVEVNVPSQAPNLQDKTVSITENGNIEVTPDTGYDGINKVNVTTNVPNQVEEKSVSITANGTTVYEPTAPNVGIKKLTVSTNVPSTPTEEKTVELSMASGNQVIEPTGGKVLSKVTVNKPNTLLPENIKNNINIGGVIGTLTGGGVDNFTLANKFIVLTFGAETGSMTITPTVNFTNLTNPTEQMELSTYASIMYADYDATKSYNITLTDTWDSASFKSTVLVCYWGLYAGEAPDIRTPTSLNPLPPTSTNPSFRRVTIIIIRGQTPDD